MSCSPTSHGDTMRKININHWSAFADFLVLEQGIEGKQTAMKVYFRRFRTFITWLNGRDFTRAMFRTFMSEMRAKGCKNSYLNNFVKTARHIDKFLGTEEMKDYKMLHKQSSIPKDLLTPEEITSLTKVIVNYGRCSKEINMRQSALIMLFATTGCRNEEAVSLKRVDIDSAPAVTFRDTKNGQDRRVPISHELYARLQRLTPNNEYIFAGSRGSKLTQQAVNRDLKLRAELCGIKKRVYSHLFRHSFCTEMVNQGVNPLELAKITGHRDLQSLMVYYHQSINEAQKIIMLHPMLRPSLTFEQQALIIKNEAGKILNTMTADLNVEENSHELVIRLKRI